MDVVHQADKGLRLRYLREEREDRKTDAEPVRRRAGFDPERDGEGIALRTWQSVDLVEERRAQLMEHGERELHLGLDAGGTYQATTRRVRQEVFQER